jgi:hypothetical protein
VKQVVHPWEKVDQCHVQIDHCKPRAVRATGMDSYFVLQEDVTAVGEALIGYRASTLIPGIRGENDSAGAISPRRTAVYGLVWIIL